MKKIKMFNKTIRMSILCWLLASSAYAMPTGGTVVSGNVTNVSNPSAVMAAQANSIVDWNKFNIAQNEKVVFNTNTFTILNRVNGGEESKILGILQDQGKGHLILMNPSGIVVGENAVIDANKLTLTTLTISESDFKNLLAGQKATFKSAGNKGVALNANSKISVNEALNLYGGRIAVADGVEIVSKEYGKASANIMSVGEISVTNMENSQSFAAYIDDSNEVRIGKAVLGSENAALSSVDIRGANVTIDGVKSIADDTTGAAKKVTRISGNTTSLKNSSLENKQGDMVVVSSGNWSSTIGLDKFTAEPVREDYVNVTGSSLKTGKGDVSILAADVDIYGSNIDSGKNLIVGGVKRYDNIEGVLTAETYSDSTVNVDDATKVKAVGKSTVYGAILNVNWNKFDQTIATENPLITIQGKDDVTIEDIIEKLQNIEDKEELQRILNLLQTSNGQIVLVSGDTKKLIKPDVQSVEDFMKNNNGYTVLVGEVTQDYIDYLREKNKGELQKENSKDSSVEKNDKTNETNNKNIEEKSDIMSEKDKDNEIYWINRTLEDTIEEFGKTIISLLTDFEEKHNEKLIGTLTDTLKNNMSIIGDSKDKNNVPDLVIAELLRPVAESILDSKIDNYDSSLGTKFVNQIENAISNGLKSIKDSSIVVGDKKYNISYQMNFAQGGVCTTVATVTWSDANNKDHSVKYTINNINDDGALADYGKSLAKLTQDVTENAALELVAYGLQDIASKNEIKNGYDFAKKLVTAMTDEKSAEQLLTSLGAEKADKLLEKIFDNNENRVIKVLDKIYGSGKKVKETVGKIEKLQKKKDELIGKVKYMESRSEIQKLVEDYNSFAATVINL